MNTSFGDDQRNTSSKSSAGIEDVGWSLSPQIVSQFVLAMMCINAIGVMGNGLLVTGLLLLRGSGRMSSASVQMLLQQATIDSLTCAVVIAYALI